MGIIKDIGKKKEEKKKSFNTAGEFWDAWIVADELQKNQLVQSLSVFNMIDEPNMRRAFVNLVNSYLVDLHSFMANRMRYMTEDRKQVNVAEENRYGTGDAEVSQVQP